MYGIFIARTTFLQNTFSIQPLTQSKLLGSLLAITILVSKMSLDVKRSLPPFSLGREGLNSSDRSHLVSEVVSCAPVATFLTENPAFSPTIFLEKKIGKMDLSISTRQLMMQSWLQSGQNWDVCEVIRTF